jgi:SSS family transporter
MSDNYYNLIENPPLAQYIGQTSFFGGVPPLGEWVGYFLCLGFGAIFCIFTLILVYLDQAYAGSKITSEQFNTAGRSVKIGLTAAVIVSQWTWAATLLQSSNVAWNYGVSGPFWYASGATIQVLLFGILAIELKRKAKCAHTVCEMVNVRWGTAAHLTFIFFCLLANVIVTGMLILGGAATVNALTGMDVYAAGFLIPVFVIPYTMAGGLKATFMASYVHTAIIFMILVIFTFTVYVKSYGSDIVYNWLANTAGYSPAQCTKIFSEDGLGTNSFFKIGTYACGAVKDNEGGSYLTMLSLDGLRFGIINIVGNFGTVFVDQSYWQSAIAAKPAAAHKGYLLGGMVWFTIPFALATSMGLTAVALQLPITSNESAAGLVPPAVATHLYGASGSWLIAIMLFMAIVSTGSAESIAVSSLVAYDIYRTYCKPKATGKDILFVSRIAIVMWGLVMGGLSAALQGIILVEPKMSLGWVYTFMGNAIGSAVPPLWFLLTWKNANATGAILGAWLGLFLAIISWVIHASTLPTNCDAAGENCETGIVSVSTLGALDSCLTGNLVAILSSALIHFTISYMYPQNYNWDELNKGIEMVEDDMSGLDDEDYSNDELNAAYEWIVKWGSVLSFVLVVVWPLLSIPAGVFTKQYFAFWIFVALVWGFVAATAIIFWPLWESVDDIVMVARGVFGMEKLDSAGIAALHGRASRTTGKSTPNELHGRIAQLENAIRSMTGKKVVEEPPPQGCM